ncbi:endonuclease MutS2 [Halomicronema hongdechloris]|uniref:endonuclease MutS2 n=1 Tax=Halomicronema hongdechloris TaxID=1209493 RepID=UPI000B4D6314
MIQQETLDLLEWPRLCQQVSTFAATKLGAIAAQQLVIPTHQGDSERLLAQTQEAYRLDELPPGLKFTGIHDIGDALDRAGCQGILQGDELLAIATTLNGARQLRRFIDSQEEVPVLSQLVSELRTYPELEQTIHHCIDERGRVADRASEKLTGIREKLNHCRDQIYQKLQRILQRQGQAIQQPVITQRGDRFVLAVKAPQKDAIPGIVHDSSTSGATLYVEPHSVVDLGNRLRQLQRQEQAEDDAVRRRLSHQVAAVQPDLEQLLAIVTSLDLATARARYSRWLAANLPRFTATNEQTTLRQLRHPLLVWQQQHEEGPEVVPIDVIIRPQLRVIAITGPNTGGKTVTLKTLGLAALMAKAGLFLPAREPVELPWFSHILADIGDEQSIEQSLSTFSGHIKRISRILAAIQEPGDRAKLDGEAASEEEATAAAPANALVLLDEVGAGTDPSEGSALATALLQSLADQAQLTVATTHYGELKALKYQDDRFENASVEFDEVSLSPTYRLLWGIPGRSNALTIARRLGLATQVIEQAEATLGTGSHQDVNQIIAGLEAQRQRQEDKAAEAAQLVAQAERLHQEVTDKARFLRQREQSLQQQQTQAIQAAVTQARAEIAKVIRRLQQGQATAQEAQQATDAVNKIAQQHQPAPAAPAKAKPGFRPQEGDRVRLPSLGQTAEVLSPADEDGKLTVRFGLMKTTVSLADVESLQGEKVEMPSKPKPQTTVPAAPAAPAVRTSRNTFDLRGLRVSEAEAVLDDALARAQGPIWIIHGHGTGKLRAGVQEYLKHHPQVQRFEAAEQADGGTGVTVAHL